MEFRDRTDAGKQLAAALVKYKDATTVIYALPRGGVVLGFEVAKALHVPLDLVIVRKIGHPSNPEYAVCAVTESGRVLCNKEETDAIEPAWLEEAKQKEQTEAKRRRRVYCGGGVGMSAVNKIAIIVDDGVATGLTLELAIHEIRQQKPERIIVAVPVIPKDTAQRFRKLADELVALIVPDVYLGAVGAYYQFFPQVEDEEVVSLIEQSKVFRV